MNTHRDTEGPNKIKQVMQTEKYDGFFMVLELDSRIRQQLTPAVTMYTMKKIEQLHQLSIGQYIT